MGETKLLEFTFTLKTWIFGFSIDFDEWPMFINISVGPLSLEIAKWRYWKRWFKKTTGL